MTDPDGVATGAVVLRLAGSRYALPLAAVVEVGRVPPITWVPGLPSWLVGVTNWRGRLLAVVDLGPLLGGPKTAVAGTSRLLLVSQAAATLGVLADSVDGVGPVTGELEPAATADGLTAATGTDCVSVGLDVRVADLEGLLVADADDHPAGAAAGRMATFLSMPLRGYGGQVVGVLALSSAERNAFGESALSTLRLIEGPAAIVIDHARLAQAHRPDPAGPPAPVM